jgi:glutathione S-transferase
MKRWAFTASSVAQVVGGSLRGPFGGSRGRRGGSEIPADEPDGRLGDCFEHGTRLARFPEAQLAPTSGIQHARMQQWLGFIGTELHEAIFVPLLNPKSPDSVKEYSRANVSSRFALLQDHFAAHEFVLERFSIADAYLVAVLNWCAATVIDLKCWPAVHDYHQRMLQRPSIARAWSEELTLYKEERIHHAS